MKKNAEVIQNQNLKNIEDLLIEVFPTMKKLDNGVLEIDIEDYTARLTPEEYGNHVVVFHKNLNMLIKNDFDNKVRPFAFAFFLYNH